MVHLTFKKKKKKGKKKKISLWLIVGPISSLKQMFKDPSPFKPFVDSFLFHFHLFVLVVIVMVRLTFKKKKKKKKGKKEEEKLYWAHS
jgi:hypothetical protein